MPLYPEVSWNQKTGKKKSPPLKDKLKHAVILRKKNLHRGFQDLNCTRCLIWCLYSSRHQRMQSEDKSFRDQSSLILTLTEMHIDSPRVMTHRKPLKLLHGRREAWTRCSLSWSCQQPLCSGLKMLQDKIFQFIVELVPTDQYSRRKQREA